jgi:16S rRNA (uracil1498-N3)-methyltransferase
MAEAEKIKVSERWKRIAQEAAKQSGSLRLVDVRKPLEFGDALHSIPSTEKIIVFHPSERTLHFKDWIEKLCHCSKEAPHGASVPLHLFFGPEGGFSETEMKMFEDCGSQSVSLGSHILKVDTAFLGVISALRLLFE